jgi:hypothetical protein
LKQTGHPADGSRGESRKIDPQPVRGLGLKYCDAIFYCCIATSSGLYIRIKGLSSLTRPGYRSIKTDVINSGAKWEDAEVVVDQGVVTSRKPEDLEAFSATIIEEIAAGHRHRAALHEPSADATGACLWLSSRPSTRSQGRDDPSLPAPRLHRAARR